MYLCLISTLLEEEGKNIKKLFEHPHKNSFREIIFTLSCFLEANLYLSHLRRGRGGKEINPGVINLERSTAHLIDAVTVKEGLQNDGEDPNWEQGKKNNKNRDVRNSSGVVARWADKIVHGGYESCKQHFVPKKSFILESMKNGFRVISRELKRIYFVLMAIFATLFEISLKGMLHLAF